MNRNFPIVHHFNPSLFPRQLKQLTHLVFLGCEQRVNMALDHVSTLSTQVLSNLKTVSYSCPVNLDFPISGSREIFILMSNHLFALAGFASVMRESRRADPQDVLMSPHTLQVEVDSTEMASSGNPPL
jgi:hypothetical protein